MADVLATRRGTRCAFPLGSVFWIVFADERRLTRPLTLFSEGGREALAVFSHEEEADLFLRSFGTDAGGWRARETSAGEVVSLLYGPSCGAKLVALDPLPEMLADGYLGLVLLERVRFVERVVGQGRGLALPDAG